MRHTLSICRTCLRKGEVAPRGEALAQDVRGAVDAAGLVDVDVRVFDCFSACSTPNALTFRAKGKAVYVFTGVDPANDCDDIVAFAKMYLESADGWIEDARPCGRLRFCLTARIPAEGSGESITAP